jgi:hypothetical protein
VFCEAEVKINIIEQKKRHMIKRIYIPILFLFASCSYTSKEKQESSIPIATENTVENNVDTLSVETEAEITTEEESDCIFDQSTQTDKFLKGIEELKDYKWDAEEKIATIALGSGDTLLISRGGCYQFGVSAEFRLRKDTTDYSNWKNVYEKVLWISKLLSTDFAYEEIRNELNASEIERDNNNTYFSNEYLQDNNYELYREIEADKSTIVLSHYVN